jgi:hypothetical protein
MILAEELLSRDWECFELLARRTAREGNRISLPKLERPSSGVLRQREVYSTSGCPFSLVVQISHGHSMEMPG